MKIYLVTMKYIDKKGRTKIGAWHAAGETPEEAIENLRNQVKKLVKVFEIEDLEWDLE